MNCAVHTEVEGKPCAVCQGAVCDACATYEIDGKPACEKCGHDAEERGQSLSAAVLAFTSVGYLAVLVAGVWIWNARAWIGGAAAIGAIMIGRLLQLVVKPPVVEKKALSRSA